MGVLLEIAKGTVRPRCRFIQSLEYAFGRDEIDILEHTRSLVRFGDLTGSLSILHLA